MTEKKINIWTIINSRPVAVLVGVAAFLLAQHLLSSKNLSRLDERLNKVQMPSQANQETIMNAHNVAQFLTVTNIQQIKAPGQTEQKFIAQLKNSSSQVISDIHATITYFGEDDVIIDAEQEWFRGIGAVFPGTSKDLVFKRRLGYTSLLKNLGRNTPADDDDKDSPVLADHVQVEITHFKTFEPTASGSQPHL